MDSLHSPECTDKVDLSTLIALSFAFNPSTEKWAIEFLAWLACWMPKDSLPFAEVQEFPSFTSSWTSCSSPTTPAFHLRIGCFMSSISNSVFKTLIPYDHPLISRRHSPCLNQLTPLSTLPSYNSPLLVTTIPHVFASYIAIPCYFLYNTIPCYSFLLRPR
jgi:hypothetical protein